MNEKLRKFLERCGLDSKATEDEAFAYLDGMDLERAVPPVTPEPVTPEPVDEEALTARTLQTERARVKEINSMCVRFELPDTKRTEVEGLGVEAARIAIMEFIEKNKKDPEVPEPGARATIGLDETDKFRAAAEGAIMIRSGMPVDMEKVAPGAQDLAGYSLVEFARHSLVLSNQSPSGSALQMVGRALTTSDFPYLLANVANKSLWTGWEDAEETWQQWCATGSVSDFKTNYSPRVSEFTDLEEIPEDVEYKYGKRTEAQESYSIVTYGKLAAISRQSIINDDLNAITSKFMGMGEAAARKVGDLPIDVLTANAAMGDDVALFHATHANFVDNAAGAAPGIATIAAGILAMGTQKDLQSLRRLNIRPVFLLAPKALEGTSEVFFMSDKFVDNSTVATDSSFASTRVNPYSGKYFTRIYEGRLDDDDAAAWYLAARKGKTITIFFLNGEQKPYTETKQGWSVDGVEYKVRIDAGAKALDYRGLYFNDGN